jgi:twinkle protein
LQVFLNEDGSYTGYCFVCGTYDHDPYRNKPKGYKPVVVFKSKEQIQEEINDVMGYRCVDLPDRHLRRDSLDYFGVRIGVSEEDGTTPISHHYPYYRDDELVGFKNRIIEDKRIWSIGDLKEVDLFGWHQAVKAGGRKLFITEGELDAVALYQALRDKQKGTKYEELHPAVVSIQHGAASAAKDIARLRESISRTFKEVVLVFDMDEAGRKAVEEVSHVLDITAAVLPAKDANECLIKGRANALVNAVLFNASKPKNSRLVHAKDLHEAAKKPAEYGVSWPWKHVTEATRGIRLGETIYIGAGQKQGKSEVVNTLAAHFIKEHGWKVLLCKPEEANNKTYKLVAGKMVGKFFHDPTKAFDEEAYDKAGDLIGDNLFLLNIYQHVDFETLKGDIKAAVMDGCKSIIIDPITNFTNGMDAASANTKLQEIAQELAAMALDLNIVIFIFCHLRNPDSGPPHERGGEVQSHQFAGSRAMARSCNLMLGLEGNRDPNLSPEERNVRTLVLLEDREFGQTGRFGLYWDNNTGLFNEIH